MQKYLVQTEKKSMKSIYALAILTMTYGLNNYLNYILIIGFVLLFALNIKSINFYLFYFALIFYDSILVLPHGAGSMYRLYQVFFVIRIIIDMKNSEKLKISRGRLTISIILILWALSVVFNERQTFVSMSVNVVILLYILGRIDVLSEKFDIKSKMLFVIGFFSMLSGFYGLYNGRIINVISGTSAYTRFSGTIGDPNYSAMFYLIGFFALMGTREIKSTRIKLIMQIILLIFILLTVSITGITGTILLHILYTILATNKDNLKMLVFKASMLVGSFYFIPKTFANNSYISPIILRFKFIIERFGKGDYESMTSSRYALTSEYFQYFRTLPTQKIYLGGTNLVSGSARSTVVNMFGHISHNTYIDLLFALGIVGTSIIVAYFIYNIIKLVIKYRKTNQKEYISIAFIKLVILWFSTAISIFPYRYYILILLI